MSDDKPPNLSALPPLPPPTTLIDLPEDLIRRITAQLDSSLTCLALALTHSSLQHTSERAIWTTLDFAPPLWYGCRPIRSLLDGTNYIPNYSMETILFQRDRAIHRRLEGILLALEPQPGKARHVRKVIIELSSRCSERYMDFLEQVQVHITELVIQHPGSEMSPRPNLSENSAAEVYFFQDITLRSFTFTQLVSLRLTVHFDAMPNTARFLSLCPQLSQLCLECPTAVLEGQFGFAVDASFLLEKLESLDIAARGLNSLAWLVMLKTLAPNLKRASLRKVKHIPEVTSRDFKRAREISSPITKSIMGLTSLEWGLDPARIEDICPAGMEQSLTSFTTASTSHTAAMDRLEFLRIPPSSELQRLHLVPKIKCRFWPKRIQPGEELKASNKLHLVISSERDIFDSLVSAPNLLEIRMKTANTPPYVKDGGRWRRNKSFRGILVRSYANPKDGKILIRTETSARNQRIDWEPSCTCAQPTGLAVDPTLPNTHTTSEEPPMCPICDAHSLAEDRLSHLRFSDVHSDPVVILVGPLGPKQAPASVEVRETDGDLVSTVKRFNRTDDINVTHEAWYDGMKVPSKIMDMVTAASGESLCAFVPDRAAKMEEKAWSVLEQWAERECAYRAVEREFLDKKREERDMAFQLKEREQLERVVGVPQLRAKQRAEEKVEVPWRVVPLAPERG